jgi:uncharacterized membrane protein YhaH (DUF805 family)
MSFANAIKTCVQKYAEFRGRASRPEFWWFALLYYLLIFALAMPFVLGAFRLNPFERMAVAAVFGVLIGLASLALLLPYLAVGVRRLHDMGKSGAWWFIALVPFGWVVLLVFFASDGDPGWNRYGPPPGVQATLASTPGTLPPPPPPP